MVKIFQLNDRQKIIIPDNHIIYDDVLIANIANQDIEPVCQQTLWDLGYKLRTVDDYWEHPWVYNFIYTIDLQHTLIKKLIKKFERFMEIP